MIKYNPTYNRWVTDKGEVYRKDKSGKLILCKQRTNEKGYMIITVTIPKHTNLKIHRLVWITFNGPIPDGMEIDHQDANKENNELSNLKCCTHKENMNNPLTVALNIGNDYAKGKVHSEFGRKFKEHYGITKCEDERLYNRERLYWLYHNHKCRWE